jgi:hypothetical protein
MINLSKMAVLEVPGVGDWEHKRVQVMFDDNEVQVVWLCGAGYTWTKEGLRRVLENFEVCASAQVLYSEKDSYDKPLVAYLDGENFVANETIESALDSIMSVPWEEFRLALYTASDMPKPEPPAVKSRPRLRKAKK